ncbi:MAG: UDP-galactopyranose mutase [Candidatus Eremiobacteraeota bacterium]|nr:UDP-galactopyranose mutase [Candidatus Eremiobacteraeota bacterium]
MSFEHFRYLVAGAGFFGATIAERIAADMGEPVALVEKRAHIGGNCYTETDRETGIEFHKYGSHIFHTSSEAVWRYISRFSPFNDYQHKVLTEHKGRVYQMPINLSTINAFYEANFKPSEARAFLCSEIEKEGSPTPSNFEEVAISSVGRPLYEALIRGYSIKQWGVDPRELPSDIMARLPVSYSYHSNYFNDPWQGLPLCGYTGVFEKMLAHPNISLHLNTDFFEVRHLLGDDCLIVYTGPLDRFFNYRHGRLAWRTSLFEREILEEGDYQGTAVMNYADSAVPFTRIHEFRHLHRERAYGEKKTLIFREYSKSLEGDDEPYYPVNRSEDRETYERYMQDSRGLRNVIFGGRLGTYRYLNMDRVIEAALKVYEEKIKVPLPPSP